MTTFDRPVWSGSYLEQLEYQRNPGSAPPPAQPGNVYEDEDWDMEAEHEVYMAKHQDIEEVEDAIISVGQLALATVAVQG